ncbi:Regulator of chromosome condensation (RCC1) repeat-containing protein [Anaerosphaera aminiphila DSM 21120]|uniref:Regulator of chromosome condensation (RCC1) repeat-containing protein n=1 Tax=Anaerosphaera aminiphila DSM 21120 TaxID=1120995 RepID=A0A1M5QFQ3_9FIRM|nr:hypothetical protein [Anaerosphaera aminiphila]SHH12681.1 Regulator of chromosome condensation (RCC1) repeat-containing protein [Anaerosphaera aminiphila DSM 21120]
MKKKKFLSLALVGVMLSGLITPVNAEENVSAIAEPEQKTDYLTAADLYERYKIATGGTTQTQNYTFDYSKDAPIYDQLSIIRFTQTASGKLGGHALDVQGKVWSWGYNLSGRTGIGQTAAQQMYLGGLRRIPYFVDKDIKIVKIAAGYETGYALSDQGKLYAWGRGLEGQMGNGTNATTNVTPVEVNISTKIVDFYPAKANQAHHIAAVDENGDIFMWGYGSGGRIPGSTGYNSTPIKVSLPTLSAGVKFIKVSPGDHHTLALADDGTVWAMGSRARGVLGDGSTTGTTTTFSKINALSNITAIDTSYSRNVAMDKDGNVFEWGQIFGGGPSRGGSRVVSTPTKVIINSEDINHVGYTPKAQKVFAGESVSFFIDQKGRTWAWGDGRYHGQAREGGYMDALDFRQTEATLYPRITGDGDTQDRDRDKKFPIYATNDSEDLKQSGLANKHGYGFNNLHPTAWDEKYMLKDDSGVVLDNNGKQLEYRSDGYYYEKGTNTKGMPAIDPKESWIGLTFLQPGYTYDISTERSSSVFLDLSGNIFKTSYDGSGSIAWGWDWDSKYFAGPDASKNAEDGIADAYVYEYVYMRGLPSKTNPTITKPTMENIKIYKDDESFKPLNVTLTAEIPEQIRDDNLGLVIDAELESVDWVFVPYNMENSDAFNLDISGETKTITDMSTGQVQEIESDFDQLVNKKDEDGNPLYISERVRDGEYEALQPGETKIDVSVPVTDNGILFIRSSFNQYGTSNGTVEAVVIDNFYTKAPIVHNGVGDAKNFADNGGKENMPVYANTSENVVKTKDDSKDTKLPEEQSKKLIGFPLDVNGKVINSRPTPGGNSVIKDVAPTFGYDTVEVSSYEPTKFKADGWDLLKLGTTDIATTIQKHPTITLDDKQTIEWVGDTDEEKLIENIDEETGKTKKKIKEIEYVFNYIANGNILSKVNAEFLPIENSTQIDEHYGYVKLTNPDEKFGRFYVFKKEYSEETTLDKKPINALEKDENNEYKNLIGVFESDGNGVLITNGENEQDKAFYEALAGVYGGNGAGKVRRDDTESGGSYPIEVIFQEGPITVDKETEKPMEFGPGQKLLSNSDVAKVEDRVIKERTMIEIDYVDEELIMFYTDDGATVTVYANGKELKAADTSLDEELKYIIFAEKQAPGTTLTIVVKAPDKSESRIDVTV